jgi:hypothetical protein
MDRRISRSVRAVDAVTGRKRIVAFMSNKVTELRISGYVVVFMVMSDGGELQDIFGTNFWLNGIHAKP